MIFCLIRRKIKEIKIRITMEIKSPSELNLLNFAALYDTTRAISSELDILPKEKVSIDAIAKNFDASLALVFTQQAFSDKTLGDLRYKALQYLQECKQITSFEYRDDAFRERIVEISLDPERFVKFFSGLEKIYDDRWKDYENLKKINEKNLHTEREKESSFKIPEQKTVYDLGYDDVLTRKPILPIEKNIELALLRGQIETQSKKSERQHRQSLKHNRILASSQDKYNHALDIIIEKFEFQSQTNNATGITIDYYYFNFEDRMDDSRMLEAYFNKLKEAGCFEEWGRGNYSGGTKFSFSDVKLNKLREFKKKELEKTLEKMQLKADISRERDYYNLSVKDREIWVNETYLISKPYAIGSNLEFFLYLLENPNREIKRSELPQRIKEEIGKKRFIAIFNALGFKGEILKLFFPKRGKTALMFNQNVSKSELDYRGIKETILLKELELAHSKNSPK